MSEVDRDLLLSLADNLQTQRLRALLESDHDEICQGCERLAETGRQLAEALNALAAAQEEINDLNEALAAEKKKAE